MTRPGETEAVEAMRRVLFETRAYPSVTAFAADLIGVAYPVIAAAVREQVAQEIEAHAGPYIKGRRDVRVGVGIWPEEAARGYTQGIDEAVEIARGVA